MNKASEEPAAREHRLTLPEVVDGLVEDGIIPKGVGEAFKKERRYFKGDIHPLVVIADQKWKALAEPHKPLTLEFLAEWLARRT